MEKNENNFRNIEISYFKNYVKCKQQQNYRRKMMKQTNDYPTKEN